MTTKEWSHLPNAKHIDWVLDTLKEHPDVWEAARSAARDSTWVSWGSAFKALSFDALDATRDATRDAVGDSMRVRVARDTAWGATGALIAWDESSELLDMSVEGLVKEGNHAAVLLLPAVIVKHKLKGMK